MRTLNKIKIAIAALFVGLLGMAPLASFSQNENGVTDQGESTTKVNGSYVNENGKFVCWPRVSPNGKLLTYGPVVTTDSVNSITSTTATLYGNVVHDGWCGVTEQGFEVSTDANFTTIVATVVMNPHPSFTPCIYPACLCAGNEYHKEVTGLTAGTHYYYRAYAENPCDPDPSYGDTLEFDTPGAAFIVSVTPDDAVVFCPGATGSQNLTYTVSYSPSTIPSPTFQWYFDGTAVSGETGTTYTRTYTNSVGSHTVKCEVTSSGITRDGSVTTAVSNYTVPSLAISGDASICAGATGNLTATTGFDSYAWSSNVASSSTNTATYTAAGTYNVTATTSDGCTATATKTVTVTNPQVASATGITGNTTICSGSITTLTANATASTGATLQYQWKKNGTAISGATSASYTTEALTANTSYSCDVTAVQDGCTSSATTLNATVTIETSTLASVSIAPATQTICAGETATLTANASGYNGTLSYQWKQGTTNVGTNNASYTTPALSSNTTYTCVVTNTTTHGCTTSLNANATVTVTTPAVAINSITASPSTVCMSATTTLTPTMGSYSGTLSYAWSTGASGTGVPGAITTGALTSNTTYKLTVTATTGSCSVTATKSITITVTNTSATTNNVASVTCVSATLSGSNTACSDARGFVYSSTNSIPTVGGTGCTNISVTNGTGSFTNALSGLTPNTTYHVRAYSHSADGYVYGTVRNFTTSAINVNVVAQNGTINLCQEPKQTVVTMTATPDCDATNAGNTYAWSLSPAYPYTASADGKTITVTVTSSTSEQFNVTGTCTLTHSTGYTVTASDYSIIYKEGTPPDICVCEDSYNGTVAITDVTNINASTIQWYTGTDATGTPITALNGQTGINTGSYAEGYYTIKCTSPLGCVNTRTVTLGFPFDRCASLGTNGSTSETTDANGVWQITDNRSANGNTSTTYRVIKIGSQCWMAENLRYKQAVDGLTAGISRADLVNQSIYTYPIYFTWPEPGSRMNNWTAAQNMSAADVTARYGYLYTWVGAMDMPATLQTRGTLFPPEQRDYHIQGVCPDGWHLPTDGEFFQLEHELGVSRADSAVVTTCIRPDNEPDERRIGTTRGSENDAGTVAATGCDWYQNTAAHCPQDYCYDVRNDRGFSAVPGGVFVPQYDPIALCFQIVGQQANFWTASQALSAHAGHDDFSDAAYVHQLKASQGGWGRYRADKHNGLSVRCVRDMVTTATPTNVTTSSATVGGTVLEDAGYMITERGICWSNNGTVSIAGPHRAASSGVGAFTMTLTSSDIPSGEYQYCAYAINEKGVYYGLTQTVQLPSLPEVVTGKTSDINATNSTITLHGEVTSNGGYPATTRGICWSTNSTPTISDNVVPDGTGTGAYSVTITSGLNSSTTYYYRAYATNPEGTAYGEVKSFVLDPCGGVSVVSYDGSDYHTTRIGSQCWLTANIRADNYADGSAIPRGSSPDGSNVGMTYNDFEAYYYEAYDVQSGHNQTVIDNWGRLYNWQAATRGEVYSGTPVQGVCPNGWHIPTTSEFVSLMNNAITPQTGISNHPWAFFVCKNNSWNAAAGAAAGSPAWGALAENQSRARTEFDAYPVGIIRPAYAQVGDHLVAQYTVPEGQWLSTNFWCADANVYPYFSALMSHVGLQSTVFGNLGMSFSGGTATENHNSFGFSVRCVKD